MNLAKQVLISLSVSFFETNIVVSRNKLKIVANNRHVYFQTVSIIWFKNAYFFLQLIHLCSGLIIISQQRSIQGCYLVSKDKSTVMWLKPNFGNRSLSSFRLNTAHVFMCVLHVFCHRGMWALQWENCMGMISARQPSLGSKLSTSASKTCASSNLYWRSGWVTQVGHPSENFQRLTLNIDNNFPLFKTPLLKVPYCTYFQS